MSKFTKKCMASGRCPTRRPETQKQPFKNVKINEEMYGHPYAVLVAYYWVYLHQTWAFCKTWSALYNYVNH